jgi:hypothetical protein
MAIERLLNDQGRLQSYGDASRSIFDAEFRLEVSLGQTLALLDRVARQRE